MQFWVVEAAIVAACLAGWFGCYAVALLATRARPVAAAAATQELGTEPPALVSVLVNDWRWTEDAAESTLLDLAARGVLEFRQPADDPRQSTVHLRDRAPAGLSRYEQQVFDRVVKLSSGGVAPVTALTFRNEAEAAAWHKRLRAAVVADLRQRGLSRPRFGARVVSVLGAAAVVAGVGVAAVVARVVFGRHESDAWQTTLGAWFVTVAVLSALAKRDHGERDTAAGRAVAARWLGLRAWLSGDEAFADLPPAAVAVWGRYIGYGAAVGVTRVASAVIDLGMGNRRRVWSSYGGTWHRVRVHYPRLWPHYGRTVPALALPAMFALAGGYVLTRWWRGLVTGLVTGHAPGDPYARTVATVGLAGLLAGIALLAYGGYTLTRAIVDMAIPDTMTGQVLWKSLWRSTRHSSGSTRPALYYLAVDAGRGNETTAWALPIELVESCDAGDTVTVTVRRWSRRVVSVSSADPLRTTIGAS